MGDGKETNSDFDKAFYNDLDEIDALHEELIPLSQDEPDQTHQESTVLSRFRVLLMHIICYLYSSDVDYEMMMMYLRELLDWLEEQSEVHALVLPPDKYSDIPIVSKIKRVLSSESDLEFDIDEIIRDCISETITEEEMNAKLPTLEVVAIAHNSTQNPLCIWEQMFDPSDFGIDKFILPLQGGKFGVLIQLMILQSLKGKSYDARVRTIILVCSQILKVDHATVRAYEDAAINTIAETNKYKKKRTRMGVGAMATVGLAAAGGAAIMTFTGGLAAPFVVAGLSSIVGTSSVAFLGTTAGLAAVAATFGAVGGGLTGYKVSKLVGSIEEFEFVPLKSEPSASLTIAVNGWVKSSKEISAENWQVLNHTGEQYILKYEGRYLAAFSNALNRFLTDFAVSVAADEMIKNTILATLASSLAWPVTILSLASVIDNPWSVCLKRSKSVGVHLAEVLTSRVHGDRPVSLIGYGLGARVIFFCLLEMVLSKKQTSGIIENAVMLGAPVSSNEAVWSKLCTQVSGKLVNGFSSKDWVLGYLYRTTHGSTTVAGLNPVNLSCRRMCNIDLSSTISGHGDYAVKMGSIIEILGMDVKS